MMTKKRKRMKKLSLIILALIVMANSATLRAQAFVHEQSKASDYEWPADPAVLAKLDSWQDCKFGVLFHWGLYSVPGIVESWALCSEDHEWNKRPGGMDYDQWKKWYWDLKRVFNPVLFNPDDWADAERPSTPYMRCLTGRSCQRPSNGQAISPRAPSQS